MKPLVWLGRIKQLVAMSAMLLAANVTVARTLSAAELAACFEASAKTYGVNVYLIKAIALHESNMNPWAINTQNFNDSEDIGIMQINSWWLANSLHRYGIDRERLWNPCLNIRVGTWILAQEIANHGRGWTAIGYYNARSEDKRLRYIERIKAALRRVYSAYGIVETSPTDPTMPVSQIPKRIAKVDGAWNNSATQATERMTKEEKPAKQRRIIVVSADSPQGGEE